MLGTLVHEGKTALQRELPHVQVPTDTRWRAPRGIFGKFTALVPLPAGCFDLMPVRGGPSVERGKRFIERTAEVGDPVEGGGFDAPGVHVANDQSVLFGSSKRVGKDLG
jgi:hypothetical protein